MVSPPSNARVPTMRLAAATCVFLTAVSAANGQAPASPPSPAPLTARAKGRPDAPVTVYEMSDFQCPYCRSFALTTMPLLEKEYVQTGKVRFVYINLPLTTRHPNAAAAARPRRRGKNATVFHRGRVARGGAPRQVFPGRPGLGLRSKTTDRAR